MSSPVSIRSGMASKTVSDGCRVSFPVRSEKNGTPAEKKVSPFALNPPFNVDYFFIFQISGLWRNITVVLAIQIQGSTKQRSGVAVNMTLREWEM